MLNLTDRYVVYLDSDTLRYMYLNYTKARNYPVMTKLYSLLSEGYKNNLVVTPLTFDHVAPYINESKIEIEFLNMMAGMGQLQFLQRLTVRTLQLIRVINSYFEQNYKRPVWKDAFTTDPDEHYMPGFNKYHSLSPQIVSNALEREKKSSKIYFFIESFKEGKSIECVAEEYYSFLWEEFPDLITPYLPIDGPPEIHFNSFIKKEEIQDIPEFHIISSILYPLFETTGIKEIEMGSKDDLLFAAETMAAYMPYCNFYITTVDIAELALITGINLSYTVQVYDHNESSLYKFINDLALSLKTKDTHSQKKLSQTIFRKK